MAHLIPRVVSSVVSPRFVSLLFRAPLQRPLLAANRITIPQRWYGGGQQIDVQELTDRTLNVLKLFDKVNPEKVTLEAHFLNDLGLDSLDAVEIVMAFEDEFGVEISDEDAEKIFTCNDAIELLKVKLDIH